MRRLGLAALALLVAGIALLAYAASTGEMQLYILAIIPIVQSSSPIALAGMALIFVAIFLAFFSMATPFAEMPERPAAPAAPQSAAPAQPAKKFGGVVFIGPVPIVFGSDRKMAKWMLAVALVIVIVLIIGMWFFATQWSR